MSCFTRVFSYIRHTKKVTTIGLAALSLGAATFASAADLGGGAHTTIPKSEYDSYIVVMTQDPAIAYDGGIAGFPATKPGKNKKLNPKSAHVRKYTQMLNQSHNQVLSDCGVPTSDKRHDYNIALNGFAAKMSHDEAILAAKHKGVVKVMPDELRQKTTDNSPSFLQLDVRGGPYARGYNGEGVVVGVIDSGIWPEHPSFADDGTYGAPPIAPLDGSRFATCEFGNMAHNPEDALFTCNNKLIGARQMLQTYRSVIGAEPGEFDSARDEDGHGSHTASTAAGNSNVSASISGNDFGLVSGIAPRAHIIAYKGLGEGGGFGSDLAAAIDQAVADGVDVINYSIGSPSFAIGPDDVAFLFAASAGVMVATSNGNAGPAPATTGSPSSVPWLTSVGASTQDRTFQGAAVVDGVEYFGASITEGTADLPLVDSADAGSELCVPDELDPAVVSDKIVLCLRGDIARIEKSRAVQVAGGAGMILYNADDGQSQVTDTHYVPSVHINNTDGLAIKNFIDTAADPTGQITAGVFTVVDAPFMASFSSRGPNRLSSDLIKPDVTAPGVNILAGASPVTFQPAPLGELFQSISGTSMSSPHVAGIFALLKQARPDWSPAIAKSALMTTAHQNVNKEDNLTAADPFDMGAGHIRPGGRANRNKSSVFQPWLAYDAGLFEYAAFTCGADLGIFSAGDCDFLADLGVPADPSDLNLPSIGIGELAGSQTVVRTVTSVADQNGKQRYAVNVDAPPGYKVSVTPRSFRLQRGMSASYEVTITNVSAPTGEWRFGSLTWAARNGRVKVTSPIAVNGTVIAIPDQVAGAGEDGSASFDVKFGYNGAYTAAPHGLEPATVTDDNVEQDPDQAFDPDDGFSNTHAVDVSGAALLKFAIPPEATEADADLDIYLFGPDDALAATSTNGGTDEVIEVVNPADGTWTLHVQGWQAPGGDSDYRLYNWVVSATPGGNLSVDNPPTSATLGAEETIGVSWTGATAGQWHLGAVSHSDANGVIGLTKVEVDNR